MAMQKVYIPDTSPGMSAHDRNIQLSAELATAPNVDRNIVDIARDDTDSGWQITYME
jgi:hypothetical protein